MTLQNLRGRGLLLERLLQLACARLQILEQPRVLDRDDGLVGEGLKQRDLLVGRTALPRAEPPLSPQPDLRRGTWGRRAWPEGFQPPLSARSRIGEQSCT